jgi:TRAP-type uncharacterized transport system substrate-binding protein
MDDEQARKLAIGAGLLAFILGIVSGRTSRPVRVALVLGAAFLALGSGVFAYRQLTKPTVLRVAAGSLDSDATRLVSALATRIAANNAPVRLDVVDKGTMLEAIKAFNASQADLVVARADIGDLSNARTLVVMTHAVVMLVSPAGSPVKEMEQLKGKSVGVVMADVNQRVVSALSAEYDLSRLGVRFKDIAPNDVALALKTKQVDVVLAVVPMSSKYLMRFRSLFPKVGKQNPNLIPIEAADAIATVTKYLESFDVPKGSLQGAPPIPDDDTKGLRIPYYLLAQKKLSNETAGKVAKAVMEARHDLLQQYPGISQLAAPNTDKSDADTDAYIPVHPGAAAYFDGEEETLLDKYGDALLYGSMVLGSLMSILAAAWKYIVGDNEEERPLLRLSRMLDEIEKARDPEELAEIEKRFDEILRSEITRLAQSDPAADQPALLDITTRRVEEALKRKQALTRSSADSSVAPLQG